MATTVFLFLMAAGFVFGALVVRVAAFAFLLTSGILVLAGLVVLLFAIRMARSVAKRRRLLDTGVAGVARLVSATQTSTTLNGQPYIKMTLEITVPGNPPYTVERGEFVPVLLLSRLTSGQPLPVKVDPARRSDLAILWNQPAP